MRRRALLAAIAAGVLATAPALGGCGGGGGASRHRTSHRAPPSPAIAAPLPGPALGLTEDNANLLWSPDVNAPPAAGPFLAARRQLSALRPRYIRLLVNWAVLQPGPRQRAALEAPVDGCARGEGPCGAYAGIAEQLAAVASAQRRARAAREPEPQVVLDILGVPGWAAAAPHGCEAPGAGAFARPLRAQALASYGALIADLLALARRQGTQIAWWSPWNEPNDPRFLTPQRAACSSDGAPLATAVYSELARAMNAQLSRDGAGRMLLGELGGYLSGSPHRLSVVQFVQALPADVLCMSDTWAIHSYATWGPKRSEGDAVTALEAALLARGGCAGAARIWVTEAGAGAPRPGRARLGGATEEREGCRALAGQLRRLISDPQVDAIFQYTFRDDPAYPVGLTAAGLGGLHRTYSLWHALGTEGGPAARERLGRVCG
jgi:hypothetical protein